MHADDMVLLSSSGHGLSKHLHTLSGFCKKWDLEVNTEKTKICVFGRDTDLQPHLWNGVLHEKVQSYKYLGIFFAKNGKFNRAMEHLAMKAMFSLQATLKLLGHPPLSK